MARNSAGSHYSISPCAPSAYLDRRRAQPFSDMIAPEGRVRSSARAQIVQSFELIKLKSSFKWNDKTDHDNQERGRVRAGLIDL